jgi:hypothetical protein
MANAAATAAGYAVPELKALVLLLEKPKYWRM